MAIKLTLTNTFQFFATITPFLIIFFMVMTSLFNQNIKGLVYLAGLMIAAFINIFIMNIIKEQPNPERFPSCDLFQFPFTSAYVSPALSSLFIAFTFAYLALPMQYNNNMNYGILITFAALFAINAVSKVQNKCTSIGGILFGGLIGYFLGVGWFSIFHTTGNDSLLYFSEVISNNVLCSRPAKQTFKCAVYKNGELLKNL